MLSQSKRRISLFAALCLFCSIIELAIPKPVFIRLGFSNSPLLVALYCGFNCGQFAVLVALKVLLQGFINGTLFSYAFILSAAGSLSSSLVMFIFYKILVLLARKGEKKEVDDLEDDPSSIGEVGDTVRSATAVEEESQADVLQAGFMQGVKQAGTVKTERAQADVLQTGSVQGATQADFKNADFMQAGTSHEPQIDPSKPQKGGVKKNKTLKFKAFVKGLTGGSLFSFIAVSELGAFVSNIVQIFVSHFFLGDGVYTLAPVILGCGIASSFVLGFFTQLFCIKSEFLHTIMDPSFFAAYLPKPVKPMTSSVKTNRIIKIVFSLACLVICLFTDNVSLCGFMSFVLMIACLAAKRRIRIVPVVWTIFRTVAISLFVPAGRILFSWGALKITQDSIFLGLHRSFVILSSTFFSRYLVPKPNELESAFSPDSIAYLSLSYFKEISEEWYKSKERNVAHRIDKTLLISIKKCSNLL